MEGLVPRAGTSVTSLTGVTPRGGGRAQRDPEACSSAGCELAPSAVLGRDLDKAGRDQPESPGGCSSGFELEQTACRLWRQKKGPRPRTCDLRVSSESQTGPGIPCTLPGARPASASPEEVPTRPDFSAASALCSRPLSPKTSPGQLRPWTQRAVGCSPRSPTRAAPVPPAARPDPAELRGPDCHLAASGKEDAGKAGPGPRAAWHVRAMPRDTRPLQ